jgi:glycosyltransferase involved in cell wall biosynthesis
MRASIVVPVYNHRRFLPECLMSVYQQNWDDLELVIIDDASTDDSFAIAERFSEISWVRSRFAGIVVERNRQNIGAAATINRAILKSSGDAVMILNSDDRYHPQRVPACVDAICSGARFVFTGIRCIDERGDDALTEEAADLERIVADISRYPSVSLALLEKNRAISTGNFCFTRELATAVGLFRPLRYCHDWDFVLSAMVESEPRWIEAPYYEYRLHELNSFRSLTNVAAEDSRACLQRFFQAIDRRLVHNPTLRMFVNAQSLWEGMVRRGGALAYSEWVDAKSGIIRRPASVKSWIGEAPVVEDGERAAPTRRIVPVPKTLQSRIAQDLFLTGIEGEVYSDCWISETATFSFQVGPNARRIEMQLYLGSKLERRIVTSTLRTRTGPDRENMAVISPDETILLSFDLDRGTRSFEIIIRVPNAKPEGGDLRTLGVVIQQVSVVDDENPPLTTVAPARARKTSGRRVPATSPKPRSRGGSARASGLPSVKDRSRTTRVRGTPS